MSTDNARSGSHEGCDVLMPTPENARARTLRRCGVGRRLLAMLYDSLIVLALAFVAGLLALLPDGGHRQFFRDPLYTAWILGVWFAYLGWCWTHGGQTVGLRAWRARLIVPYGGPVSWRASAVRFLVSLLSAAPLGAGFWWAWTNEERATWHDIASGTRLQWEPGPDQRGSG